MRAVNVLALAASIALGCSSVTSPPRAVADAPDDDSPPIQPDRDAAPAPGGDAIAPSAAADAGPAATLAPFHVIGLLGVVPDAAGALATDETSTWDHSFVPAVVVVALGTNDFTGRRGDVADAHEPSRTLLRVYVDGAIAAKAAAAGAAVAFVVVVHAGAWISSGSAPA